MLGRAGRAAWDEKPAPGVARPAKPLWQRLAVRARDVLLSHVDSRATPARLHAASSTDNGREHA